MRITKKNIIKWMVNVTLILGVFIVIKSLVCNKLYINGNNENNIKRSILKFQKDDINEIESMVIIKTIDLEDDLIVIYKKGFDCGIAEFSKDNWSDYKINYLQRGELDKVNFYLANHRINRDSQYFIVYGDGNNIDLSRVDLGINNNIITINIPKEDFVEVVNINQYNNGDNYSYTYKFYDDYGKEVEQYSLSGS